MRYTSSTLYIVLVVLFISGAIVGLIISCDENEIDPPVVGPAAGTGPVGGGDAQKIVLTASPSDTITVTEGDRGSIKITARVENNIGQPMPDGTSVLWTNTVGDLDSTTTTTSNGTSTVTLTFPKSYTGCSWVSARAGDAEEWIQVCVQNVVPTATPEATATPAKTFVVQTSDTVIPKNGTATITATAKTNGQPDTGLQVNFTVSGPGTLNVSADVTDDSGIASVTLTGNNTSGTQQTIIVTATSADGRSGNVQIIIQP